MKTLTTWEWLGLPPTYEDSEEDVLASISYLWGDDCLWGDQIDALWNEYKSCLEDPPSDELETLEVYFRRGEKKAYIPYPSRFFLVPIKTPEEAKMLFGSRLFDAMDRNSLLTNYIFRMEPYRGLDWYEGHMKNFIKAFYSDGFVRLEEKPAKKVKKVSPESSYWCKRYVWQALTALKNNKSYDPCYDCILYFLSILPYANDNKKHREQTKINDLLLWINSESADDNQLSGNAAAFLENLRAVRDEIVTAWKQGEESNA